MLLHVVHEDHACNNKASSKYTEKIIISDIQREKVVLSKQQCGFQSFVVWNSFTFSGVTPMALLNNETISKKYKDIIYANVLP